MSNKKTRVTQSFGDPGRWQAQYYDSSMKLWFDIGDSRATEAEAAEVRAQYLRDQVHAAKLGQDGHCGVCGQRVSKVPGGNGPTYVHTDSGAVAAPNPPRTGR
jgi:hypothetical protein